MTTKTTTQAICMTWHVLKEHNFCSYLILTYIVAYFVLGISCEISSVFASILPALLANHKSRYQHGDVHNDNDYDDQYTWWYDGDHYDNTIKSAKEDVGDVSKLPSNSISWKINIIWVIVIQWIGHILALFLKGYRERKPPKIFQVIIFGGKKFDLGITGSFVKRVFKHFHFWRRETCVDKLKILSDSWKLLEESRLVRQACMFYNYSETLMKETWSLIHLI